MKTFFGGRSTGKSRVKMNIFKGEYTPSEAKNPIKTIKQLKDELEYAEKQCMDNADAYDYAYNISAYLKAKKNYDEALKNENI